MTPPDPPLYALRLADGRYVAAPGAPPVGLISRARKFASVAEAVLATEGQPDLGECEVLCVNGLDPVVDPWHCILVHNGVVRCPMIGA